MEYSTKVVLSAAGPSYDRKVKAEYSLRVNKYLKAVCLFLLVGITSFTKGYAALTITLSTPAPVAAANVCQYATNQPIYKFTLTASGTGFTTGTFTALTFTQSGSAGSGEIVQYKLWAGAVGGTPIATSTTASFSFFTATQSFTSSSGTTISYIITADIAGTATPTHTIVVSPLTTTNFTVSAGTTKALSGTIATGGIQTIIAGAGLSGVSSLCAGSTITLTATTTGGTWATSTTTVATVSGGIVGGVAGGASTISYTLGSCTATQTESVSAVVTPSVNVTPIPSGAICAGTSVLFFPTAINGGTPTYQWYVNGSLVSSATNYSSTTLANGNTVYCVMTSSLLCVSAATATSATTTMTVNPAPSLTTTSATLCGGTTVTLTGTPTGGTWVSSNTSRASVGTTGIVTGGALSGSANITYTYGGCTATQAEANTASVTPAVTIAVFPTGAICAGTTATFTPTPTSGGTPTYQWYVNGTPVATTTTYTSSTLSNGDVVSCTMTSSVLCVTSSTATSNSITMAVNVNATPPVPSLSSSSSTCHSITLNWAASANASNYEVTIATNPGMTAIVYGPTLVGNITSFTLSSGLSASTPYYYEVRAENTCGGGYSALTSVTTDTTTASLPGLCECIPTNDLNCTTGEYIANVSIAGTTLNNTTTCSTGGYSIYPATGSTTATLVMGTAYTLSVTSGTFNDDDALEAFIDYNQDNSFETTEFITISNNVSASNTAYPVTVTIPLTAAAGPTTLRVRYLGDGGSVSSTTSCTGPAFGATHGEVEDYTVCLYKTTVITAQPTASTNACPGGASPSLSVTATGSNLTYLWFNNGTTNSNTGGTSTGVTTATFNAASTASVGTTYYYCQMTNACGIVTTSNTAAVTVESLPTATATATPAPVCAGNTLTVNATPAGGSGTYTGYSWSGPGSFTASTQSATNSSITASGAGVYSVTVTDNLGCTSAPATTPSVTVASLPTITATATPAGVCPGGTVTLNATPAGGSGTYSSFTWNGPGGFTASTQNTTNPGMSASSTGIYSVSVTDNNGCTSATAGTTASVTLNSLPTVTASTTPAALCVGATLTLNATPSGGSGTYTSFSWNGPGSFTATTQNTTNAGITAGGAGIYSVTVTDNNGCTSSVATTGAVTVHALPTITATATPATICAGSTLTLNATPAGGSSVYITYVWNGPGGFASAGQNTSRSGVSSAGAGTYSVTVTDNNGCTSLAGTTASVTVASLPTVTAAATPTAVCVGSTLTLNATPAGGSGTYPSFTWSGPGGFTASSQNTTNPGMSSSGVGVYSVSVTDNNGCTSASAGTTASVTLSALPTITATVTPTALCAGGTVSLNATPAGGSGTYSSFSWNGPGSFAASTQNAANTGITAAGAGTYSVTVTDNNGCTSAAGSTGAVTVNALPNVSSFSLPSSSAPCPGSASTVNVNATGLGSAAYTVTYNLSGANTATSHTASLATASGTGSFSIPGTDLANSGSTTLTVTAITNGLGCNSTLSSGNTATVTVNPNPVSIGGTASVCLLSTITLTDASTGGTWASSNASVATVDPAAGIVFGAAVGTATVVYTLPTGCLTTIPVLVNPIPNIYNVTGGGTYCTGNPNIHVGLDGSDVGASYQVYVGGVATGGLITGTGSGPLDLGLQTAIGSYTVKANPSATCAVNMTGSVSVSSTPSPNIYSVTGGGGYCAGGTGVAIGLGNSQSGISYQLFNGSASGSPVTGAGTSFSFGLSTGAGTYTVIATNTSSACTSAMTGSALITINPVPPAITGTAVVCTGFTTTLSNAVTGGVWSSSSLLASIGSTTGIVSGILPSTPTITYTAAGCSATRQITVNPSPLSISGPATVCSGSTISLSEGSTGGTWSSSTTSVATVGATGTVTSITAGPTNIAYTLPAGCASVVSVTVNPQPSAITGPTILCTGVPSTLNDAISGGTWSSSNSFVASAGAATGVINGIVTGTATITYTLGGGCTSSTAITVNPSGLISGPNGVCPGSTISLTSTTTGGTWISGTTSVATVTGGTGITSGVAAGTATITYTTSTGCTSLFPVTVNSLPALKTVTGGGNYCSGGTGVHVGLNGSDAGVSYQLFNGVTASGSPLTGTGSSLDFGLKTNSGTYTVVGTNTATGCTNTMTGNASIAVNPLPAAYAVGGGGSFCSGTAGADVSLSGSVPGIGYQLYNASVPVGSSVSGTGLLIDFGLQGSGGTYGVVATNASTGCYSVMSGSAIVTALPLPTAYSVTGGGSYCAGGPGVHVYLTSSAISTSYQLYNSGVPAGSVVSGTGVAIDFGSLTAAGVYTVIGTNTTTSCAGAMSGSATITINPLPPTNNVTGGGGYCPGTASTLPVGLNNSVIGNSYQLLLGGSSLGSALVGTGLALSFGIQSTPGTYTVRATTNATGCTALMSGSAIIVLNSIPTAYAITGGGSYCPGSPVSVHVGIGGSTSGVSYQLYNSSVATGAPLTGTGAALDFGALAAGSYTAVATSGAGCTNNMTGSASISVSPAPSSFTIGGGGSYCSGGAAPHVTLGGSVIGATYQLLNGVTVAGSLAGTGSSLDFGPQSTAGSYTVKATNVSTGCTATMTGAVSVSITALPIATFSVTGGGSYCAGGSGKVVGLSGSTSLVSYQLYVGGIAAGSALTGTGSAISFPAQTAAGSYTVVATNSGSCTSNMTGSVSISTTPLPVVYNVTGGGGYCAGTTTGVHIGLASSNTGINYQLYIGGSTVVGAPMPGAGAAIDFGAQTSLGTYTIVATNPSTLCTSNMFGNAVVTTNPVPAVYTLSGGGSYCSGGTGLPLTISNSDIGVSYQLLRGGVPAGTPIGGTGTTLGFGNQTITGSYAAVATNASGCTSTMAGVSTISTTPLPAVYGVTSDAANYCAGSAGVHVRLTGSATGFGYQLYNAGVALGTSVTGTGATLDFGAETAGVYTVIATNNTTSCTNSMAGTMVISTTPLPTQYAMTGGGNYCNGGTGVDVGLGNSNTGISYQLNAGGLPAGVPLTGTGSAIHFGFETAAGAYTVIATNTTTGCTQNMTGTATVGINPSPALQTVTGGGNYCAGGTGVDISLSGSVTGTAYQLFNGLTPAGTPMTGTGTPIDFGYQTIAGNYSVVATTTSTACAGRMADTVNVGVAALPNVYSVTGGGNYCPAGTGVHVGLSGSDAGVNYRLYNGITPVGSVVTGSGSAITFGSLTGAGTYTVVAQNPSTTCTNNMSGSATIMLSPLPVTHNVTGGGNYCPGGTGVDVSLDGSDAGNTYQLYNGIIPAGAPFAGTGFAIDFGLQTAPGAYTVIATNTATTCNNTMTGGAAIAINALPTAYTVSGGGNYCQGTGGVDVSLLSSDAGISYQLFNGALPAGLPVTGSGAALHFGNQSAAGIYTVIATNTTTTCSNNMTGSADVGINPLPTVNTVTGGGNYCSGGTGVHVGLSGSATGTTYQLYNDLLPAGASAAGTGSSLDFGIQSATGAYTVVAVNTATSCTNNMAGSVAVGINPLPAAYTVSGSASQYCAGGTGVSLFLGNSDAGVNYQLYAGSVPAGIAVPGTGLGLNFGLHTSGATYTVVATNAATGCVNNMSGSATITINPLPTVYTVAGGGNYCSGGDGVHVSLTASNPGITYQLYNGVTPAGSMAGTGFALDFGPQATAGTYTVIATNPLTTCGNNMAGSATVNINALPALFTVTGGGNYCAAGTGVHVGLTGSSSGVTYQLSNGAATVGAPVTGSGTLIDFGLQTVAGTYTVVATNAATGCSNNMPGAAYVVINPLPASYSVTGGGNYCAGGTGLHVGMLNSDAGITYQLYNGIAAVSAAVPGTGIAFDFGAFTTAGSYTVVATNATTGCTRNMPGTAAVVADPLPGTYTVTGGGNYCAGSAGVHIGLDNSNAGITYQLYNGALPSGLASAGTGSSIDFGVLSAVGTYSVVATNSTTGCVNNMTGTAAIGVNPLVTPAVTLLPTDTICAGNSITINSIIANGGPAPTYSWTVNGLPVAASSASFTYTPAIGDVVGLTLTSSALCATPATTGTSMPVAVLPHGMPVMSITSNLGDTVCQGSSVTFTPVVTFGGSSPAFAWMVNGINHGTSATYSYTPADGDVVYGILTSNYQCRLATSVISNHANMAVDLPVTPTVAISANPGTYVPQGEIVILTSLVTNTVIAPSYQWSLNGEPIAGATNSSYVITAFSDNDSFACTVTSGGGCAGLKGANSVVLHNSTTGVQQVTAAGSDIKLVPNPNRGIFTVKGSMGTTADEEVTVEVTDMLGQVVYNEKVMAHGGNIDEKIQISNTLANGMYLLNLRSANANEVFHVVIEQ